MGRRKNPHPKRAVNARTVLKVVREKNLWCCVRGFDDEEDDLEANHHQIQKEEEEEKTKKKKKKKKTEEEEEEETARIAKGIKRTREGTSAMFARRCLEYQLNLSDTCVLTQTRDRMNVICARRDLVDLII